MRLRRFLLALLVIVPLALGLPTASGSELAGSSDESGGLSQQSPATVTTPLVTRPLINEPLGSNHDDDDDYDDDGDDDADDVDDDGDDDDDDDDEVTICHRSPKKPSKLETKKVDSSKVPEHLGHGDTLGACPETPSK
jgi:hypothetical protein